MTPTRLPAPLRRRARAAMRAAALAATALLAGGTTLAAQQPRSTAAAVRELDAYVAAEVPKWKIPGLAIAVVKGDSVVFAKGYGIRELGKPDRVDAHTLFAIGSTTKAMTAASLAMLVEEGKVRWNDPVLAHLPALQLHDPYMTRELTVGDLLTHFTGLGNADLLWVGTDYSLDEIIRRMRFLRPAASFRSRYAYQNIQYAMAGEILARASGVPWADFVRTRIFEPLGMRETVPTLAATRGRPNVATPHLEIRDTVRVIENRPVDPVAAAGSVWSSVTDMARWMRFVLDSGRVGGGRALLEPETVRTLLYPKVALQPGDFYPTAQLFRPHFINYGYGWFLHDYAGKAVAMHTGSIDGMIAILGLIPDERLGVMVLANLDHAELRHALMLKTFDLFAGTGSRDWSTEIRTLYAGFAEQGRKAEAARLAARVTGTRPTLPLSAYVGEYADSLYGRVRVTERDGALHLGFGTGFVGRLEHWQHDVFRAHWDDPRSDPAFLWFTIGRDARPTAVTLDLGPDITFGRVPERR